MSNLKTLAAKITLAKAGGVCSLSHELIYKTKKSLVLQFKRLINFSRANAEGWLSLALVPCAAPCEFMWQ